MVSQIYRGVWINWNEGAIQGATLTLSERDGGLLTAFIAVFITIAGTQLWKLLAYIFHQIRSRDTPQDGLYHQQQIIFRNISTPGGAAWKFIQQSWYWRGKVPRILIRTIPWALFATAYIVLFGVMAVYSSDISKSMSNTRLVLGDACGYWAADQTSLDSVNAYQARITNVSYNAAAYARDCYGSVREPLTCTKFMTPSLSYTEIKNVSCPFGGNICLVGPTGAYSLTTKMIDTQNDLGINSPPRERLRLEKSLTCSPLRRKGYVTTEAGGLRFGIPGDMLYKYNYGPIINSKDMSNVSDYTHLYNNHTRLDSVGYFMDASLYYQNENMSNGGYSPIPELNVTNADTSIIFMSANSVAFSGPSDDPFFSAHLLRSITSLAFEIDYYITDAYVNVMACTESYLVCNPNNKACIGPVGANQILQTALNQESRFGLNLAQTSLLARLADAVALSSPYYTVFARGASALRAAEVVSEYYSQALPANQWQIEVQNWFNIGLAGLQAVIVEYATGPTNIGKGAHLNRPAANDTIGQAMCGSQLIRDSSDTMSFSILGLVILVVGGGIIIIITPIIDIFVGFIQYKFGIGQHMRMGWLLDDKFQMHRMLSAEMRLGNWKVEPNSPVPVTITKNEVFLSHAAPRNMVTNVATNTGVTMNMGEIRYPPGYMPWRTPSRGGYVHITEEEPQPWMWRQ